MRPNNFDLVRLLAAFQVVFLHGAGHLQVEELIPNWFCILLRSVPGVPIFFVISGFLVSASYRRSKTIKSYTVNRAFRIYPGLWVCLIVSIASVMCLKPEIFSSVSSSELFAWLAAQVSFVQFYNPEFLRPYGLGTLNGSLWTIPVELQFYVLLPVLYFLFGKNKEVKNGTLLILILVFLASNQFFALGLQQYSEAFWCKILACTFLPHFWLFLVGVAIQQNFDRLLPYFEGKFIHWCLLHAALVTFTMFLNQPYGTNFPFPLVGLSLAGLTMAAAYTSRGLANQLLNHNDISYGVYIYHGLIINAFVCLGLVGSGWSLLSLFVLTVSIAYLSWRLVERPFMRLKKKLQDRGQSQPGPELLPLPAVGLVADQKEEARVAA